MFMLLTLLQRLTDPLNAFLLQHQQLHIHMQFKFHMSQRNPLHLPGKQVIPFLNFSYWSSQAREAPRMFLKLAPASFQTLLNIPAAF